ncbi:hypothetical protein FOPE_05322 [Fonsecaea pedrosoi]|nr:hypothetical protein FOPE_05322 [Fonsecaea pedrosoi]
MNATKARSGLRQRVAHLNMRKGTKSCHECRRRKTKCIYRDGSRSRCEECYARGTPCVAQSQSPKTTSVINTASTKADGNSEEAKYSLRERVARLEDFVQNYLSHESSFKSSNSRQSHNTLDNHSAYTDPRTDGGTPTSTNDPSASNPILSLFDNDIITQAYHTTHSSLAQAVARTEPPAFHPGRYELLLLLPHDPDLDTLISLSEDWWNSAPHRFPELFDREETTAENWRSVLNRKLSLANPAETAKVLLWALISAERLSEEVFQGGTFRDPGALATLESRIIPAINRAVVFQDDITTTLPGIECLVLLARYHCNHGRLQKAWHLSRRALEYAISIGLNRAASIKQSPITPGQSLGRQIEVWEAVCFLDRYISMILGLPYGVRHPYPDLRVGNVKTMQSTSPQATFFYAAMSSIIGQIIDRNQEPLDDSVLFLRTLKIDQELKEVMDNMNTVQWDVDPRSSDPPTREAFERIEAHFLMNFIQALLHLPLMLKCIGKQDKGAFEFSFGASLKSSRHALVAYKYLRVGLRLDRYLCAMLDFQAFTLSVLLTLHLLSQRTGNNSESNSGSHTSGGQDERDWKSVTDIAEILRAESTDNHKSIVATQAVAILDVLFDARGNVGEHIDLRPQSESDGSEDCGNHIKMTIPCFGDITFTRGTKGGPCFSLGASANTLGSAPDATAAFSPLAGQGETVLDAADLCAMAMSLDDSSARFDGNWDVLASNVASAVAASSK